MATPSSFDPAAIRGNLTDSQKHQAAQIFTHFIGTPASSFAAEIGRNLKIVEINVSNSESMATDQHLMAADALAHQQGFSWDVDEHQMESGGMGKEAMKDVVAQTVCEIDVTRNMCNIYGTLHGGCAAYIIDPCSVSALVSLGIVAGIDGTGVSQSMSLQWYRPALLGTKLKVVSTTMSLDGYIRTARSELRDRVNNALYVSATHSTINTNSTKGQQKRLEGKL